MIRGVQLSPEQEEQCAWIDEDDDPVQNQEKNWLKRNMSATTDQFLVTPTEDQKGSSAIFEVPSSELKKKYTFGSSQEKSLPGTNERSQLFERPPWQKLVSIFLAELIGTAILMFFGCMGDVPKIADGQLGPYSGAIAFSGTVAVTIIIIGHISNCHINPCVTLCALLLGKLPLISAFVYVVAEFSGALIGYGLLVVITPYNIFSSSGAGICVTSLLTGMTPWQGVLVEAITTGVLILLVCAVWDPRSGNGDCGPLKFLVIIFMTSVVVGPFTGNSLNPARSLAPAIYNNSWAHHWIYWIGPFSGTIVSTLFYKYVFMVLDSGEREK